MNRYVVKDKFNPLQPGECYQVREPYKQRKGVRTLCLRKPGRSKQCRVQVRGVSDTPIAKSASSPTTEFDYIYMLVAREALLGKLKSRLKPTPTTMRKAKAAAIKTLIMAEHISRKHAERIVNRVVKTEKNAMFAELTYKSRRALFNFIRQHAEQTTIDPETFSYGQLKTAVRNAGLTLNDVKKRYLREIALPVIRGVNVDLENQMIATDIPKLELPIRSEPSPWWNPSAHRQARIDKLERANANAILERRLELEDKLRREYDEAKSAELRDEYEEYLYAQQQEDARRLREEEEMRADDLRREYEEDLLVAEDKRRAAAERQRLAAQRTHVRFDATDEDDFMEAVSKGSLSRATALSDDEFTDEFTDETSSDDDYDEFIKNTKTKKKKKMTVSRPEQAALIESQSEAGAFLDDTAGIDEAFYQAMQATIPGGDIPAQFQKKKVRFAKDVRKINVQANDCPVWNDQNKLTLKRKKLVDNDSADLDDVTIDSDDGRTPFVIDEDRCEHHPTDKSEMYLYYTESGQPCCTQNPQMANVAIGAAPVEARPALNKQAKQRATQREISF